MERGSTHNLDVIVALSKCAHRGLTDSCKSFWQKIVKIFAGSQPISKSLSLASELLIAEGDNLALPRVNLFGDFFEILNRTTFSGASRLMVVWSKPCPDSTSMKLRSHSPNT